MKFTAQLQKHSNKYAHRVDLNGCSGFQISTLEDEQEQNFFKKLRRNDLFSLLNLIPTKYQQGEALGLLQTMPATTDTTKHRRTPQAGAIPQSYICQQMNVDGYLRYEKLDNFLSEPDFVETFEAYLDKHLLSSVLMVGFNGKSRAETSNATTNPSGQDVQKGWLEKIREHAAGNNKNNVLNVGEVSANSRYKTLKQAVKDGLSKVKPLYQDSDFIAICGRNIAGDSIIDNNKNELEGQFVTCLQKLVGGCKAIMLPHFPANAILLTRLDNLSLYVHQNNIRRGYVDEPEKDRLAHYFSFNVDFVVEDFEACALLENIELAE